LMAYILYFKHTTCVRMTKT